MVNNTYSISFLNNQIDFIDITNSYAVCYELSNNKKRFYTNKFSEIPVVFDSSKNTYTLNKYNDVFELDWLLDREDSWQAPDINANIHKEDIIIRNNNLMKYYGRPSDEYNLILYQYGTSYTGIYNTINISEIDIKYDSYNYNTEWTDYSGSTMTINGKIKYWTEITIKGINNNYLLNGYVINSKSTEEELFKDFPELNNIIIIDDISMRIKSCESFPSQNNDALVPKDTGSDEKTCTKIKDFIEYGNFGQYEASINFSFNKSANIKCNYNIKINIIS